MNYELAKKLEKAGFPQKRDEGGSQFDYIDIDGIRGNLDAPVDYYVPSLEELIDACGDKFHALFVDKTTEGIVFCADSFITVSAETLTGKTPSEAVANLYLALNKKQ